MESTLEDLLGIHASNGGNLSADDALAALTIGPFRGGVCAPPSVASGFTWCHLTSLAAPEENSNASGFLSGILASLIGTEAQIRVRIFHHDGGIGLFVGSDDPDTLSFIRASIPTASEITVVDETPMPVPRAAAEKLFVAGMAYRLQAEVAQSPDAVSHAILLDHLCAVSGTWGVELELDSVSATEILVARRMVESLADVASQQLSVTQQRTMNTTSTTTSAPWQRVLDWLRVQHQHLSEAGAVGGWKASLWLMSTDPRTLTRLAAAMRGAMLDHSSHRRIAYDVACRAGGADPASFLTSHEIGNMLRAPRRSVPGLLTRKSPPLHVRPSVAGGILDLGAYPNSAVRATVTLADMEGHAFVTGTTGSGKTTTMHRLLAQCWNRHGIPFLVIDPVKDDYSQVSSLFTGGLRVITGRELRLNIMSANAGEDPLMHATRVAQAFRGSFIMPSPTPYVVTQLFDTVALQPGGPEGSDLFDVAGLIDQVVDGLGYAPEATSNIRASLKTRFATLLSPLRAHRFASPDSSMITGLFTQPTVITLADLADDEERSFTVLLLALAVASHARQRSNPRHVEHLLVLEEAHRVIPEVAENDDPESGSAKRTSAQLLSSMLAEVREYGEQIIVVDQSPGKVSSNVLRNTNLKIAHRIVHPDDQNAIAGALGIREDDSDVLGVLERGQAIISTRSEPLPQLINIEPATDRTTVAAPTRSLEPVAWPCQCTDEQAHVRARLAATKASQAMALFVIAVRHGATDPHALHQRITHELDELAETKQAPANCLAWAGLRHITVLLRRSGSLTNASEQEHLLTQLTTTWLNWEQGEPFTTPRTEATRMSPTEARTLANCLYPTHQHTPLAILGSPEWNTRLPELRTWILTQHTQLDTLVAADAAEAVMEALLKREALRYGISGNDTAKILRRM